MTAFVTVKESALSPHQRYVLGKAPEKWKRLPKKMADTAQDLKKFGLVETDCSWTWSRTDPGAGYYKWTWRKTPNAELSGPGRRK